MKRRIYMNHGTNVQMYATESSGSSNSNNCAFGCGSCGGGDATPPSGGGGATVIGGVIAIGEVIIKTSVNPDD